MHTPYKREIDGLRAIAVLAVVCYHAGFGPKAGFAGVDVFFVISGYLITLLLLRERDASGGIDLPAFYARRMRRILPAALVVVVAVLALVAAMLPHAQDAVARSAAASALFAANWFFQQQASGYFSPDAAQLPLLHLWSLAVEEQFYLAWPALLLLAPRARLRIVVAMLALGSFVLAEFLLWAHPSAAFFQTPARLWELGIGALVAMQATRQCPRGLAWAGLALVCGSMLVVPERFPGFGALPAVAGTALVLLAVHSGQGNALLASRPLVGLGLVSYGLYLWHWPLLALDRMIRLGPAPLSTRLLLVGVALLLAIASYRYLETPLRRMRAPNRRVLAGVALSLAAVFAVALWARTPGPPAFVMPVAAAICGAGPGPLTAIQNRNCLGREPKVVIWGDSFAFAWTPMAQVLATQMRMPAANLARDGCPPLLDAELVLRSPAEEAACRRWNRDAIAWLRAHGADTLIIVGRWERWLAADNANGGAEALLRSIQAASPHARRILVIAPTPVLDDLPSRCAALGTDCAVSRALFERNAGPAWLAIERLSVDPKVTVTDPAQWLCDPLSCPGIRDGVPLYSDLSHVSGGTALAWGHEVGRQWR